MIFSANDGNDEDFVNSQPLKFTQVIRQSTNDNSTNWTHITLRHTSAFFKCGIIKIYSSISTLYLH